MTAPYAMQTTDDVKAWAKTFRGQQLVDICGAQLEGVTEATVVITMARPKCDMVATDPDGKVVFSFAVGVKYTDLMHLPDGVTTLRLADGVLGQVA